MDPKHKEAQSPPEARVLLWEGEPVLSFFPPKVALPLGTPKRVTAYYRRLEQMWRNRWEKTVYPRACAAAQAARNTAGPRCRPASPPDSLISLPPRKALCQALFSLFSTNFCRHFWALCILLRPSKPHTIYRPGGACNLPTFIIV